MALEEFCKDLQYDVRTIPALQCARLCHQNGAPFAGGTAPFQSIDVPHMPDDGGLKRIDRLHADVVAVDERPARLGLVQARQ